MKKFILFVLVLVVLGVGGFFLMPYVQDYIARGHLDRGRDNLRKGPEHVPAAVADLIKSLNKSDDDVRLQATIELGNIGEPAAPAVAFAAQDDDPEVRYYAIWALALMGPAAKEQVPVAIKAMDDKSPEVRRKAAYALGRIAPQSEETLPVLKKALKDTDPDVIGSAAEALALRGKASVPLLIEVMKDERPEVRTKVIEALGQMGSEAQPAIPVLVLALRDQQVGWQAFNVLTKLGKPAVPPLVAELKSANPQSSSFAIQALSQLGAEAVEGLLDSLQDKQPGVRVQIQTISNMGVSDKRVVLCFADVLSKDNDPGVKQQAAYALAAMGHQAKPALPALQEAVKDKNPNVKAAAQQAINQIGGGQ